MGMVLSIQFDRTLPVMMTKGSNVLIRSVEMIQPSERAEETVVFHLLEKFPCNAGAADPLERRIRRLSRCSGSGQSVENLTKLLRLSVSTSIELNAVAFELLSSTTAVRDDLAVVALRAQRFDDV